MATLELGFALRADGDVPGPVIEQPIQVGEAFWLEVLVQDIRPPGEDAAGVTSLPLNLSWDPEVLQYIGADPALTPDSLPVGDLLVTPNLPVQRFLDEIHVDPEPCNDAVSGAPMNLCGLRGLAFPGAGQGTPIGGEDADADSSWFSRIRLRAIGAAKAMPLTMQLGGSMSFADAAPLTAIVGPDGPADDINRVTGPIQVQMLFSGRKYDDVQRDGLSGDGADDRSDAGLSGWKIRAYADDGDGILTQPEYDAGPIQVATTDGDGNYQFLLDTGDPAAAGASGAPAQYIVLEQLQDGWQQSSPATAVVAPELDTGSETLGENGYSLTVDVGQGNERQQDFGNALILPETPVISLAGTVYVDQDLDGLLDPVEIGVPNVEVLLYRRADSAGDYLLIDQMVTGPDGWYHFEDLAPAEYRITERQPACFLDGRDTLGIVLPGGEIRGTVENDQFSDIQLDAGEHGIDYLFGEIGLRASCITKQLLLSSTPPANEVIWDRQDVSFVTVAGTDGDDDILFIADGDVARVRVNDRPPLEIDLTKIDLVSIDAGTGTDSVRLIGGAGEEATRLLPGRGTMRGAFYAVEVTNAERVAVDAGGGEDLTVLRDSPSEDLLQARGNTATLTWVDLDLIATATASERVRAISVAGGDDSVEAASALDFDLILLGDWTDL